MIQPAKFHGSDNFVEQAMKIWKIPGAATLIVKDCGVIYGTVFVAWERVSRFGCD